MQKKEPASSGFSYRKRSRPELTLTAVRGFTATHAELVRRVVAASLVLAVFLPSFGITLARYKSEEARRGVLLSSTAFFSSPQLARPMITMNDNGDEISEPVVVINKDWIMQTNGRGAENTQITVDVYNSDLGNVSDVDVDYKLKLEFYNFYSGELDGEQAGLATERNPEDDFSIVSVSSLSAEVSDGVYRLPANIELTNEEFRQAVIAALGTDPSFSPGTWDGTAASLSVDQREIVQTYLRDSGRYVTVTAEGIKYSGSSNRHIVTLERPGFDPEYLATKYPDGANIRTAMCMLRVTAETQAPYTSQLMATYVFDCHVGSSETMLGAQLFDEPGRAAAEFIFRIPVGTVLTKEFDITWKDNTGLIVDPNEDFIFIAGQPAPAVTHDTVAGTYSVRVRLNTAAVYSMRFYKNNFASDHSSSGEVLISAVQ